MEIKHEPFKRLRVERELRNLTRKDLAELSGVNENTIVALEYGITDYKEMKLSTLIKLCRALKVKAWVLCPCQELRK